MKRARIILPIIILAATSLAVLLGVWSRAPKSFDHQGRSVEAWIKELRSDEYAKRSAAKAAIVEMEMRVVPHLIQELQQHESGMPRPLLELASKAGLALILRDEAVRRRAVAAETLALLPRHAAPAIPALLEALEDEDKTVVAEAERALRRMGESAEVQILETLAKGSNKKREAAARLIRDLRSASPQAVTALRVALEDKAPSVRREAAVSLRTTGDPRANIPPLMSSLSDAEPRVREAVARTLGEFGAQARAARKPLEACLQDDDMLTRVAVAEALWKVGGDTDKALAALVGAIRDRDVRWRAVMVIASMGEEGASAIPFLIAALGDASMHRPFRDAPLAATALGRIGKAAWPALLEACRSDDANTRCGAALALRDAGRVAGGNERTAMRELLGDRETPVRYAAALALIAMEEVDEALIPVLRSMLSADDDVLRQAAVRSLKRISPDLAWEMRNLE